MTTVQAAVGARTRANAREERSSGRQRGLSETSRFLGARLMTLANLMRRITALRFQRLFGLSLVDGWVVSRLGTGAPMSLDELAYQSGLAKSQMSRSVTHMVQRKLVSRTKNPDNRSEVVLRLTSAGQAVYDEMMHLAPRFNELLTAGLGEREVAQLTEVVVRLIANSRRNLQNEQLLGDGEEK